MKRHRVTHPYASQKKGKTKWRIFICLPMEKFHLWDHSCTEPMLCVFFDDWQHNPNWLKRVTKPCTPSSLIHYNYSTNECYINDQPCSPKWIAISKVWGRIGGVGDRDWRCGWQLQSAHSISRIKAGFHSNIQIKNYVLCLYINRRSYKCPLRYWVRPFLLFRISYSNVFSSLQGRDLLGSPTIPLISHAFPYKIPVDRRRMAAFTAQLQISISPRIHHL